jgi:hypothetical protein
MGGVVQGSPVSKKLELTGDRGSRRAWEPAQARLEGIEDQDMRATEAQGSARPNPGFGGAVEESVEDEQ